MKYNWQDWHKTLQSTPMDRKFAIFPAKEGVVGHPGILDGFRILCKAEIDEYRIGPIKKGLELMLWRTLPADKVSEWLWVTVDEVERKGENILFTYRVTKNERTPLPDPKAKPVPPQLSVEQQELRWARAKCKNNTWYVQNTARRVPEFAAALTKWKNGEMKDEEFLPLAVKHLPTPDFSDEPQTTEKRNNVRPIQSTAQAGLGQERGDRGHDAGRSERNPTRPNTAPKPPRLIAEADTEPPRKDF